MDSTENITYCKVLRDNYVNVFYHSAQHYGDDYERIGSREEIMKSFKLYNKNTFYMIMNSLFWNQKITIR